jgi:predicted nucleic acid-binding protein
MSVAFLDSSALVKLMVQEVETSALEADLATREGAIASALVIVECRRAVRRSGNRRLLQRLAEVLDAIYLVDISAPLLEEASRIRPISVRSLDAIHIATALSIEDAALELITYDERMADAARANGIRVSQPGR